MAEPPPPPPPPHGQNPRPPGGGLPDGNYDIFIIPPHSAGGGFLYLPSLQPHRNSFLAGVASTLLCVALYQLALPVLKQWIALVMAGGGGVGMLGLVAAVGVGAWAIGKTQAEAGQGSRPGRASAGAAPPPPPPNSGGYGQQHHQSQHSHQQHYGAGPPPNYHAPPPPPPPQPEHDYHYHQSAPPPPPPPEPEPEPASTPKRPNPSAAASGWEKAREETRKREEERRRAEEIKRKREEAQRVREEAEKAAKAKAEKEKWEQARAREKEQREKEARERIVRERLEREKEAREKEQREKEAREKAEKDKAEREKLVRERMERLERERAAREREKAEREKAEKEKAEREKAAAASSQTYQKPTARSQAGTEDAYSYRPYDKPKTPSRPHTGAASSVSGRSESSYAASHSTARTTPPPSHRGPYSTNDPDKIQIRGVYLFSDALPQRPQAQLVSGVAPVTDGLVLHIRTEGLFIDDDVRGVAQREWDVKAWTLKVVESAKLPSGLMVLRAALRDAENKKYTFVLDASEAWKVDIGLVRLKKGSQVRSLNVNNMKDSEAKGILSGLGYI